MLEALPGNALKIVSWSEGTDEEIVAMVAAADAGEINLADYWSVGDTRTMTLSAMDGTGVGESHAEQEVTFVLMHEGGYEKADGSGEVNFIVGLKDSLNEKGYMNATNEGSWDTSARRAWCNSTFYNAVPSNIKGIFKQFKVQTASEYDATTLTTTNDYFTLAAEKEVFGNDTPEILSNITEFNTLFQYDYYKTAANRVKTMNGSGSGWWERSLCYHAGSGGFCRVISDGSAHSYFASGTFGLAPVGCI